ncbi:hypothetical protein KCP78_16495 [Salmonella enterica subsp. enterica]|nr:hypothetical protein KCP78_16495 [Salmonella enterica subsp. enterica]
MITTVAVVPAGLKFPAVSRPDAHRNTLGRNAPIRGEVIVAVSRWYALVLLAFVACRHAIDGTF